MFGPTAVGKSSFVYSLFGTSCEIINADSRQVYRHLDIGTAKPTPDERKQFRHHLIDIRDPDEQFHAGDFVRCALDAARESYERGNLPIVVGGTAFYLKCLMYGLAPVPPSSQVVRERLSAEYASQGSEAMYERLEAVDPVYARAISRRDPLRIVRALEVFEISGRPLSSFEVPAGKRTDFSFFQAGLTLERDVLYERINARVESMFEEGLVDEVKRCIAMGYGKDDPGMKGIGYAEFFHMQSGCRTLLDVAELIQRNSRRFAKRQLTFFRAFADVCWYEPRERRRFVNDLAKFLEETLPPQFNDATIFRQD